MNRKIEILNNYVCKCVNNGKIYVANQICARGGNVRWKY